ncbi:ABC transporter permease [Gilvimarinus sp. SDUM040013]|uniref:ABC transporter permease n=1 Tax=Gilvimarinus gilvus TaxID=3058038 RepID=A0ABU4S0V8_9GAMM|nr:ABC transporter permease [Gilvimarinus sp. SDUM040013]MDO3386640.1 ABC transporter permease [Gilvimarinus sp. SDUM040013]MDX6849473.1 ABC transporter permease [Gilvimarinus sp. SDUM040013]
MWRYYIHLAWISVKKTPVLSMLMVLAIGMGIAACLTTLTLFNVVSSNPLAHKNETTFAVQLDTWASDEDYWGANGVPVQTTFQDAKAIYEAGVAEQVALSSRVGLTVEDSSYAKTPEVSDSRLVTRDFFRLFDIPFIYGSAWSTEADTNAERQTVISESLNNRFFDGVNSVGQSLLLEGESFTVAGVVSDSWLMTPSVYDLNMGAFKWPSHVYIPFFSVEQRAYSNWGNMEGWKSESNRSHQDFLASEVVWVQAWVELATPEQKSEFEQYLVNYIQEQKQRGRFQRPLKYLLNTPEQWLAINDVVTRDNYVLVYLSVGFMLVCLVNAIVLLLAKFLRKSPEAGLRRALGATRMSLFVQHLVEASVIGVLGSMLGLVLAWLGLMGVRVLYSNYENVAVMGIYTFVGAVVFAVMATVISGALPAWQVARTQPARYLKAQ